MLKNLRSYTDFVRGAVAYWKYVPSIYYLKRRFKFTNINAAAGRATLTIHGITPEFKVQTITVADYETYRNADNHTNINWPDFVTNAYNQAKANGNSEFQVGWNIPEKKYRIYYEYRDSNLQSWEVIIPTIDGGFQVLNLDPAINGYETGDQFYGGLTYDPAYGHPNLPGYDSRVAYETWGLPPFFWSFTNITSGDPGDNTLFTDLQGNSSAFGGYRYFFKTNIGGGYHSIPTDLSRRLNKGLPDIIAQTGEHPAYKLYNENDDPNRTKFYDTVPVGAVKYLVTLELANGEQVSSYFR